MLPNGVHTGRRASLSQPPAYWGPDFFFPRIQLHQFLAAHVRWPDAKPHFPSLAYLARRPLETPSVGIPHFGQLTKPAWRNALSHTATVKTCFRPFRTYNSALKAFDQTSSGYHLRRGIQDESWRSRTWCSRQSMTTYRKLG